MKDKWLDGQSSRYVLFSAQCFNFSFSFITGSWSVGRVPAVLIPGPPYVVAICPFIFGSIVIGFHVNALAFRSRRLLSSGFAILDGRLDTIDELLRTNPGELTMIVACFSAFGYVSVGELTEDAFGKLRRTYSIFVTDNERDRKAIADHSKVDFW